jgi:hypothetical protein
MYALGTEHFVHLSAPEQVAQFFPHDKHSKPLRYIDEPLHSRHLVPSQREQPAPQEMHFPPEMNMSVEMQRWQELAEEQVTQFSPHLLQEPLSIYIEG